MRTRPRRSARRGSCSSCPRPRRHSASATRTIRRRTSREARATCAACSTVSAATNASRSPRTTRARARWRNTVTSRPTPRRETTCKTSWLRSTSTAAAALSGFGLRPKPSRSGFARSAWGLAIALCLISPAAAKRAGDPDVPVATILAAYDEATHADDVKTFVSEGTLSGEGLTGTYRIVREGPNEREDDQLGPRHETTLRLGDKVYVRNANGNVRELRGYLRRRALTEDLLDSGEIGRA